MRVFRVLLRLGWTPLIVIPLVLLIGLAFGALMGYMIHYFKLQPFIVTLAGQFFMRGMCAVISTESIPISDEFYKTMALTKVTLLGGRIYFYVFIAIVVLLVSLFVLKFTRFGRTVYAVGGNEQSAILMGLPVARTKVAVYAISSFCAALAGVVFSFYTLAGYSLQNMGLELDAISSSVIGGTLLTGGVGNVIGTTVGVLIQGVIQTIVTYQNLNTWWTKVTIAALLCIFIVIQRVIAIARKKQRGPQTKAVASFQRIHIRYETGARRNPSYCHPWREALRRPPGVLCFLPCAVKPPSEPWMIQM